MQALEALLGHLLRRVQQPGVHASCPKPLFRGAKKQQETGRCRCSRHTSSGAGSHAFLLIFLHRSATEQKETHRCRRSRHSWGTSSGAYSSLSTVCALHALRDMLSSTCSREQ